MIERLELLSMLLLAPLAAPAWAADVKGTWRVTISRSGGTIDLVNFTPNYIPIPFGADVTRPASPPGEDSYALPPYQTAGLPIPAGK